MTESSRIYSDQENQKGVWFDPDKKEYGFKYDGPVTGLQVYRDFITVLNREEQLK